MDDLIKAARNFHDWQPRAGEQFRCIWAGNSDPFTPGKTYTAEHLGDAVVVFDDGGTAWRGIAYAGFVPEQAAALAEAQAEIARLEGQVGDWIVRADEANARADRMEAALRGDVIMPQHVIRVAAAMIDALHVLDTEAIQIADATNRSGGVDGVQILEDAERIIKAAAGFVASELKGIPQARAALSPREGEG
jgi:hypothetical protein